MKNMHWQVYVLFLCQNLHRQKVLSAILQDSQYSKYPSVTHEFLTRSDDVIFLATQLHSSTPQPVATCHNEEFHSASKRILYVINNVLVPPNLI